MAADFDPYLKWLGIRDRERPPNHYRLLGLEPFEPDGDVIEMGADRQMAHVRTLQAGPQAELSQRILNELAVAKLCLLNREKKAAYDNELRARLSAGGTPTAGAASSTTASPRASAPASPSAIASGAAPRPITKPMSPTARPLQPAAPQSPTSPQRPAMTNAPAPAARALLASSAAGPAIVTNTSATPRGRERNDNKPLILGAAAVAVVGVIAMVFALSSGNSSDKSNAGDTSGDKSSDQKLDKKTDKTHSKTVAQGNPSENKGNKPDSTRSTTDTIDPTKRPDPSTDPRNDPRVLPHDPSHNSIDPSTTKTPASESLAVGKPIDLLSKIDIQRDAILGTWRKEGGKLISGSECSARTYLPVTDIPRDYVLSMTLQRPASGKPGRSLGIGFTMDGFPGVYVLNHDDVSGLHFVDGREWNNNETTLHGDRFQDDRDHDVTFEVHPDNFRLSVDGKTIVTWKGDASRLAVESGWTNPDQSRLFIGTCVPHIFSKIELRALPPTRWPFPLAKVDLLANVSKSPASERAGWTASESAMTSSSDLQSHLNLGSKTPLDYRWAVDIEADKNEGMIAIGFPFIDRQLVYVIDPGKNVAGLDGLDGKPYQANASTKNVPLLKSGRKTRFEIQAIDRLLTISSNGAILLRERFVPDPWSVLKLDKLASAAGSKFQSLPDGSQLLQPPFSEKDTYTCEATTTLGRIAALRLELIPHESLPAAGVGAGVTGNFALSRIDLMAGANAGPLSPLSFDAAIADYSGRQWLPMGAIRGDAIREKGWAVAGRERVPHTAVFACDQPFVLSGGGRLKIDLKLVYGEQHLLGRFRLSVSPVRRAALESVFVKPRLADPLIEKWKSDKPQFFVATNGLSVKLTKAELSPAIGGASSGTTSPGDPTKDPTRDPGSADRPDVVENDSRPLPPSGDELDKARKLVRETFADEYAAAKKPEDRAELAKRLLNAGRESKNNPIEQYALFDEARGVATDTGFYVGAAEAIDEIAKIFRVDALQEKAAAIVETSKKAKAPVDCEAAAQVVADLYEQLLETNDFDALDPLLKAGQSLAFRAKNADLAASMKERVAHVAEEKKRWQSLEQHYATLKEKPDDPEANAAVGKYRCLIRDRWSDGLAMLAKSGDEALQQIADLEAAQPTDPREQMKLAEAWKSWGEKTVTSDNAEKVGALNRAAHWYSTASPQLNGLEKAKAEAAVEQLNNALSKLTRTPRMLELKLPGNVALKMKLIPAGKFIMGDKEYGPPHPVQISKAFYMGIYELTNAQWAAVMGGQVAADKASFPKTEVTWDDAAGYCAKLSQSPLGRGYRFRLPTDAEWEYACRGGVTSRNYWGDDKYRLADLNCWHARNSGNAAHQVGQKRPNPWGLYDTMGNVHEWCADYADSGYYSRSPLIDPRGPDTGEHRIVRGFCFGELWTPEAISSARKHTCIPNWRDGYSGFRLAAERK